MNRARYAEQLAAALREKLEIDIQLPVFFLDSHYSSWDRQERRQWETEVGRVISPAPHCVQHCRLGGCGGC